MADFNKLIEQYMEKLPPLSPAKEKLVKAMSDAFWQKKREWDRGQSPVQRCRKVFEDLKNG